MRYFLDISLILLILVTIILHAKRGFVRSVLGAAKSVLAVILTFWFGPRLSDWLQAHIVGERVTRYIHERFTAMFDAQATTFDLSHIFENLPSWLLSLFQKTDASAEQAGQDFAHMTEADADTLLEMAQSFSRPVASIISDLLGYAAVFLIALLGLTVLTYLLGKLADLPVIKTCDRALGLVLGVVCAVLFASVYTVLMYALLSMVEGAVETVRFHDAFDATWVFRRAYDWNIFRWIFGIG